MKYQAGKKTKALAKNEFSVATSESKALSTTATTTFLSLSLRKKSEFARFRIQIAISEVFYQLNSESSRKRSTLSILLNIPI